MTMKTIVLQCMYNIHAGFKNYVTWIATGYLKNGWEAAVAVAVVVAVITPENFYTKLNSMWLHF
jgi:hypothetical protein